MIYPSFCYPAAEMASLEKAIEVMKSKYFNEYVQTAAKNPKQPYENEYVIQDIKNAKNTPKKNIFF